MGRMDLHSAHLPLRCESFDVPFRILRAFRMDGPERNQALSVLLRELADELVHSLREAHHLRGDVVDEARPLDAGSIEMLEERPRVVHEAGSGLPIRDLSPQHVENQGLQRAVRFHMHGPGRRLREETAANLHLRIGRAVASLTREEVECLTAAVHGELSIVTKEAEFLPRCREEVPVVVLVFTDLALNEYVHAGDARLAQRVEDELSSRSSTRGGPTAAV